MIDRNFEQMSEEHMKSMTKPEGPAQEPQRRDGHSALRVTDGKLEKFDPHPATPAPSQPAGARELAEDAARAVLDVLTPPKGRDWSLAAREVVADVIARHLAQQTAAKDAALIAAERERDSLREELAALKAGKDGQQ